MREGQVVLTPLPQVNGEIKRRPALVLRELPPFGDLLLCGISSQTHQAVHDFDDVIRRSDGDYPTSGLVRESVIRLGFLAVRPRHTILGSIGSISTERHVRLLRRLSRHLMKNVRDA